MIYATSCSKLTEHHGQLFITLHYVNYNSNAPFTVYSSIKELKSEHTFEVDVIALCCQYHVQKARQIYDIGRSSLKGLPQNFLWLPQDEDYLL